MKVRTVRRILILAFATGTALTGCALFAPSPSPSPIGFNYSIENARAIGIDQVFDMNGNTVLQLNGSASNAPKLFDIAGDQLYYKPLGQYLVLNGIHTQVRVVADGGQAIVKRRSSAPGTIHKDIPAVEQATAPATSPSVHAAASDAAVPARTATVDAELNREREEARAELARIREELAKVKAMLTDAANMSRPFESRREASSQSVEPPKVIRVTFKFNSTDFEPPLDTATALASKAQRARRILIRGYTDSEKFSQSELVLANNRAQAARRYLMSKGVDESKIVVSAQAYGGFIADNKTPQGRAQNRRVDIEFL